MFPEFATFFDDAQTMKLETICYAAGLFDGEGSVRLATYTAKDKPGRQTRYQIFAGINMCDPRPLKLMHKNFGGSLHVMRAYSEKPNHRTLFGWNISSKKANAFFKLIAPHLIVKREEVRIALRYQKFIERTRAIQISASKLGKTAVVEKLMDRKRVIADELARLKRVRFDHDSVAKVTK